MPLPLQRLVRTDQSFLCHLVSCAGSTKVPPQTFPYNLHSVWDWLCQARSWNALLSAKQQRVNSRPGAIGCCPTIGPLKPRGTEARDFKIEKSFH